MLPSCLSLASRAVLLTFVLLLLCSLSQASPTSTLTPIPNPFPKSLPKQNHYASTSGTKPTPEVPYLYSSSSGSSRAASTSISSTSSGSSSPPRGKLSSHGPHKPRMPGNGSPPMGDRPFRYIDLSEFRHLRTQSALPEHQRPRPRPGRTRANAPWKKGKGVLEGPDPAPPIPEKKKETRVPAYSLEADVREDSPEMPVGKNVGKTRGGLWSKMAGCFGGCAKKA